MPQFLDLYPSSSPSNVHSILGANNVNLAKVETWITSRARGGDGFGEVKACLFVRLTTTEGLAGWGEAFILPCRERAVAEIIHSLGVSSNALETVSPWSFRDRARQIVSGHQSLDFSAASSALEMALWDINGKIAEKPICKLLGGDYRLPVPIYGNIWSETQWDVCSLENRAIELIAQGYKAIKIHPMLNHSITDAANCVNRVRTAIGDEILLMVDLDSQENLDNALQFADLIAPAQAYWFEEPVNGVDIQSLTKIRDLTGLRIVTGEKSSGVAHFSAVLSGGAADILNPDIAGIGGLLDMLEVAELANLQNVKVSPHCWNSMTVAAAAMIHVCASIPNAEFAEIYPEYLEHGEKFANTGFWLDGQNAYLSDKPGLGIDIDVPALQNLTNDYKITFL